MDNLKVTDQLTVFDNTLQYCSERLNEQSLRELSLTKTVESLHEEVSNFHEFSTKNKDEVLIQLETEKEVLSLQMHNIDMKITELVKLTSKIDP